MMADYKELKEYAEKSGSSDVSARVEAYKFLAEKHLKEDEVNWTCAVPSVVNKLIGSLKSDVQREEQSISSEALPLLSCLLQNKSFLAHLKQSVQKELLIILVKCLTEKDVDEKLQIEGLQLIYQKSQEENTYSDHAEEIVQLVIKFMDAKETSVTLEALRLQQAVMLKHPTVLVSKVTLWFPGVFSQLFSESSKNREFALECMKNLQTLGDDPASNVSCLELMSLVVDDLKSKYCKEMCKFVDKELDEVFVIWNIIVQMLGRRLHQGVILLNGLLEAIEKGFKSIKSEIRAAAYASWVVLMDNFSLDANVITNPKRLKLLTAPFKANNARTEEVAYSKVISWWHLIVKLKENASYHFEFVIIPLLKYCFLSSPGSSGLADRSMKLAGAASPGIKFPKLHLSCAEILAQLLGPAPKSYCLSVEPSLHTVVSLSVFVKNCTLIMNCFLETIMSLDSDVCRERDIGMLILESILTNVKETVLHENFKKESVDVVKEMLSAVSSMEARSIPGDSHCMFIFKFFEMLIIGNCALPASIISSRQYYISFSGNAKDVMNGTLGTCVIQHLCHPVLLYFAPKLESYFSIWTEVLKVNNPCIGKLGFLANTLHDVDKVPSYLCEENPASFIKLWQVIAEELCTYVKDTQIIDEGDGSEHDWSCIYNVLLFPVTHAFKFFPNSDEEEIYQNILKTWRELWLKFTKLTPLAPTAEPNCEVEFIVSGFLSLLTDKVTTMPDNFGSSLALLSELLSVMMSGFRFSELGKTSKKAILSPARPRKKQNPLHMLTSMVDIFQLLFPISTKMLTKPRYKIASFLCEAANTVFFGIRHPKIVWNLVACMKKPLHLALQVNPTAKFSSEIEKKMIVMWDNFCYLIETYIAPKCTEEQFLYLCPLFKVLLESSNQKLKFRTKQTWRKGFSKVQFSIPDDLFEILLQSRLPPASFTDAPEEAEESLNISPKENIPTPLSGSLLKKSIGSVKVAASPKNSPVHFPSVKSASSKRKLDLEDMDSEDFVAIKPKASKRVLTEHQMEKLKENRCDIPALYSDLSQSSSQMELPSQFLSPNTESQDIAQSLNGKNSAETVLEPSLLVGGLDDDGEGEHSVSDCQKSSEPAEEDKMPTSLEDTFKRRYSSGDGEYSEEDLDEELRRASLEFSSGSKSSSDEVKEEENVTAAKGSTIHLRKSTTPSKKTIDDVRKALRSSTINTKTRSGHPLNLIPSTQRNDKESPIRKLNKRSSGRENSELSEISFKADPDAQPIGNVQEKMSPTEPDEPDKKVLRATGEKRPAAKDASLSEKTEKKCRGENSKNKPKVTAPAAVALSPKTTRSGRRIVVPSKDLPESITSPKHYKVTSVSPTTQDFSSPSEEQENSANNEETDSDKPQETDKENVNESIRDASECVHDVTLNNLRPDEASEKTESSEDCGEGVGSALDGAQSMKVTSEDAFCDTESESTQFSGKTPDDESSSAKAAEKTLTLRRSLRKTKPSLSDDFEYGSPLKESESSESKDESAAGNKQGTLKVRPFSELAETTEFPPENTDEHKHSKSFFCLRSVADGNTSETDSTCSSDSDASDTAASRNDLSVKNDEPPSLEASEVIPIKIIQANMEPPKMACESKLNSCNIGPKVIFKVSTNSHVESPALSIKNTTSGSPIKIYYVSPSGEPIVKCSSLEPKARIISRKKTASKPCLKGVPIRIITKSSQKFSGSLLNNMRDNDNEDDVQIIESPGNAEDSPSKHSRLASSLGTPERKKLMGAPYGSRAAMMIACAKKKMKVKAGDEALPSPARFVIRTSPMRRSTSPVNNASSYLKRPSSDNEDGATKGWVKHVPSPGASPSTSILKKKALEEMNDESPLGIVQKSRRVSFADPPVSESVVIPNSLKLMKNFKAQKRLDMTKALGGTFAGEENDSQEDTQDFVSPDNVDCSKPIFPDLTGCTQPVECIISDLSSPSLTDAVLATLHSRGIQTVSDLCQLTEADILTFPFKMPKIDTVRTGLAKLHCLIGRKTNGTSEEENVLSEIPNLLIDPSEKELSPESILGLQQDIEKNDELMQLETVEEMLSEHFEHESLSSTKVNQLSQTTCPETTSSAVQTDTLVSGHEGHLEFLKDPLILANTFSQLGLEEQKEVFRTLHRVAPTPHIIDIYCEFLKQKL